MKVHETMNQTTGKPEIILEFDTVAEMKLMQKLIPEDQKTGTLDYELMHISFNELLGSRTSNGLRLSINP